MLQKKIYSLLFLFTLSQSINLFSFNHQINKTIDQLKKLNNTIYLNSDKIIRGIEASYVHSTSDDFEVVKIHKALRSALPSQEIKLRDVLNLYKVSCFIKENRKFFKKKNSIYVHPDRKYLIFPIQIYKSGSFYIHFKKKDPKRTKGGYKTFSRSLRVNDMKLYANLTLDMTTARNINKLKHELTVMHNMKRQSYHLSYKDYSLYQSNSSKGKKLKGIIQTKLFDSDLSSFTKKEVSLKTLLDLMHMSAKSIKKFHKKGYVHRDIKANNFLVKQSGKKLSLSLTDYDFSEHSRENPTKNSIKGTKGYIDPYLCRIKDTAPQCLIEFENKKASDIFSLGMTFYSFIFKTHNAKKINYHINGRALNTINSRAYLRFKNYSFKDYASDILKQKDRLTSIFRNTSPCDSNSSCPLLEQKENQTINILKKLILSMISPIQMDRPDIKQVVMEIKKINKSYLRYHATKE